MIDLAPKMESKIGWGGGGGVWKSIITSSLTIFSVNNFGHETSFFWPCKMRPSKLINSFSSKVYISLSKFI